MNKLFLKKRKFVEEKDRKKESNILWMFLLRKLLKEKILNSALSYNPEIFNDFAR